MEIIIGTSTSSFLNNCPFFYIQLHFYIIIWQKEKEKEKEEEGEKMTTALLAVAVFVGGFV